MSLSRWRVPFFVNTRRRLAVHRKALYNVRIVAGDRPTRAPHRVHRMGGKAALTWLN